MNRRPSTRVRSRVPRQRANSVSPARITERNTRRKIVGIGVLLAMGAVLVLGRAYQLQIKNGDRYQGVAKRQSVAFRKFSAKRGVITDRHGNELAVTVDVDSIYAEPRVIKNPKRAARQLSRILDIDVKKLEARLDSRLYFRYLKRRVSFRVSAAVQALKIKGIGVRPEPRRFYSNRKLAAQVLGFINFEGKGVAGVERQFDSILRGRDYEVPTLRDALGNHVLSEGFVPHAALEGHDLRLTIDRHIQHTAQVELEKAVLENDGTSGVAIVMIPGSGDILALASYPDFNPNNLAGASPAAQLNRAISMVYEPGSTMKLVTIAAALEDQVVGPNDSLDCENGKWRVGRRTIRDGNHKYGVLALDEILKVSSNICSAKLGFKLGAQRLHHWITEFGMRHRTGIELPGELRGLMRPPEKWRDIALANISFGQGLAVTPLQVIQAASVIANGGILRRPRIVNSTLEKGSAEKPNPIAPEKRVISTWVAERITNMMVGVTEEGGTAVSAAIKGFRVAGKTGTSQKIDPVTRAYSRSLYVASFVGFVPADDPAAIVLVLIDEPKKSIYGGVVAAPAFKQIAMATLSSLGVFPNDFESKQQFMAQMASVAPLPRVKNPKGGSLKVPDATSLSESALSVLGINVNNSNVLSDSPPVAWNGEARLDPENDPLPEGRARMPNFAGLSPREVINRSAEVSCDLVFLGTGRVIKQVPAPGSVIRHGVRCEVTLSPKG